MGEERPNDGDAIIPIRHIARLDAFSNRVGLALAVCAKLSVRRPREQPRLLANVER